MALKKLVEPQVLPLKSEEKAGDITDAAEKQLVEEEKEEIIDLFYPNDADFQIGGTKNILDPEKNYNDAADRNAQRI